MNNHYELATLIPSKLEALTEPFSLFAEWYADAVKNEPNDPGAMTLATVDARGVPNARVVLLRAFNEQGFVFYTNFESVKGREILQSGKAALCLHWKSLPKAGSRPW